MSYTPTTYFDKRGNINNSYGNDVVVENEKTALLHAYNLLKVFARYEGACRCCASYIHKDDCAIGNLFKWVEKRYPGEFC